MKHLKLYMGIQPIMTGKNNIWMWSEIIISVIILHKASEKACIGTLFNDDINHHGKWNMLLDCHGSPKRYKWRPWDLHREKWKNYIYTTFSLKITRGQYKQFVYLVDYLTRCNIQFARGNILLKHISLNGQI